jgi:hypothetical protein
MAGIIETVYYTGNTLYAHIRDRQGAVWNGASFESYNSANWSSYDIALTEDASSGYYKVAFPAAPANKYTIVIYAQAGGSPALGDSIVGTGSIKWDGTSEETELSSVLADAVWDEATSGHTTSGSYGQVLQIIRTGTATAGAAGSITLDASASATNDFYNNQIIQLIGGTGSGQSKIISDYDGSSKVATVNDNWATQPSTDSVFVIRAFGSVPGATAPTSSQVADAVWDELRADHTTSTTFGGGVKAESLNTQAKADVNAEVDTSLVDARLDDLVLNAAGGNPTDGSFFDQIMNKSAGQTFDSTTDALEAIKDLGSGATAGQIADAVWDEGLSSTDHSTVNTAGERLRAIDDKLPSGTISDFDEGSNNVNLNASQSGVTIGTVNALGTQAKADVNAEIVDVLRTDTLAELSAGAPSATPTMAQAVTLLYMALRNKATETSSEFTVYNNSGTAIAKASVSDNGVTFTREQLGAP